MVVLRLSLSGVTNQFLCSFKSPEFIIENAVRSHNGYGESKCSTGRSTYGFLFCQKCLKYRFCAAIHPGWTNETRIQSRCRLVKARYNECMVMLNGSADPVMAEYITIMVINNKTPGWVKVLHFAPLLTPIAAQITTELEDRMFSSLHLPVIIHWQK